MEDSLRTSSTYAILATINVVLLLLGLLLQSTNHNDPFGGDYRAYYIAGQASAISAATVYDWDAQQTAQQTAFRDSNFIPFFHPPLQLLFFAPLSKLSYTMSLYTWRAINVLFLLLSGWLIAMSTGLAARTGIFISASLYPVFVCLWVGQDGIMTLLLVAATYYLLCREADIAAALTLSLLVGYKPQLPVVLAIALLALGRKRFVAWFVVFSAGITGLALAYLGRDGIHNILICARRAEGIIKVSIMPTFRGVIARVAGDYLILALSTILICLVVFIPLWQKSKSLEFVFSTAICVCGFATLHLFSYDLTVLAIPVALITSMPRPKDALLILTLTSALLYIGLLAAHLVALFVIPTVLLCGACFRLRDDLAVAIPETSTSPAAQ